MKTTLLFLSFLVSGLASANTNLDSLKREAFRPVMNEYLHQVSLLTSKIKSTSDFREIKSCAKELMRLSDEMETKVNAFYGYQGMQPAPALVLPFTSSSAPVIGMAVVQGGNFSDQTRQVNNIWDYASNIRYFWSKNPGKIQKNLDKIDKTVGSLML